MAKLKVNEKTVDALYLEIDHYKREKNEILRENDSLRANNSMLTEILTSLTEEASYWSDTVETRTMLFRLKNILNQMKNNG
jgi:FtsZ-binding cell division protein ZapB